MRTKLLIVVVIVTIISIVAFISKENQGYTNRLASIDIDAWKSKIMEFIEAKCNCCENKLMVYPTNTMARISESQFREDLINKLDSGIFFKEQYETLNIAEKFSVGSGYRAFIWLDSKEPVYRYSYSISESYQIDKVNFDDSNQKIYREFLSKSQIEKPYCDPDTTMDVLRGSFFYTRFSVKDEKLEPEVREVLLY